MVDMDLTGRENPIELGEGGGQLGHRFPMRQAALEILFQGSGGRGVAGGQQRQVAADPLDRRRIQSRPVQLAANGGDEAVQDPPPHGRGLTPVDLLELAGERVHPLQVAGIPVVGL